MFPASDPDEPTPARVYDAILGKDGSDGSWEADRDLAARMLGLYPGLAGMAAANRVYLALAVMQAGNAGTGQFIDLGCGMPGPGSVPDVVLAHDPGSRLVCADADPDVAGEFSFGAQLLAGLGGKDAAMVLADVRDPDAVLGSEGAGRLIDLREPVCLVFGLIVHYWAPEEARKVIAGYVQRVAAGSVLAVTVTRGCGSGAFAAMQREWEAATGQRLHDYSLGDLRGLLEGLELQGEVGAVTGPRMAGPCDRPHVAGGIGYKR